MDMAAGIGTEELVGSCNNNDSTQVAKGKRTKRLRPLSPCAMTSSCSSVSGEHVSPGGDYGSFSSTTTTFEGTGQEEEDMANCLILLAQGKGGGDGGGGNNIKMIESSTATATPTATTTSITKIGFYIYECKTCNRTFPSFQALGGHRASHKKPKVTQEEKKPLPPPPPTPLQTLPPSQQLVANCEFVEAKQTHVKSSPPISLQFGCVSNRAFHVNKSKTHECSICGSEFTSGQALGGHMRRHRASTNTSTQVVDIMSGIETSCDADAATTAIAAAVEVKPRNVLELDLNLPAPEDDVRDSKFQFTTTQKSMVLSAAPALVGCHY